LTITDSICQKASRRDFISFLSNSLILLSAGSGLSSFQYAKEHSIGVLLGTVEKFMKEDPAGTLKKISEIGFAELEYPGTYGCTPFELNTLIKKNNLVSLGGGENISNLTRHFTDLAAEYNRMDKKYVFCYWPWFDNGKNKTIDDWKKQSDILNTLGQKYKESGLRLAYHNHDIEFLKTENQIPYEVLLKNLDPEWITFEMDLWWIYKGGDDPMKFINMYPGRFEVCHVKPAGLISGVEDSVNLPYREVLKYSKKAGFKHIILENEPAIENPFTYLKNGCSYLNNSY
jgi:sugar phosphate isomerase/epimerase